MPTTGVERRNVSFVVWRLEQKFRQLNIVRGSATGRLKRLGRELLGRIRYVLCAMLCLRAGKGVLYIVPVSVGLLVRRVRISIAGCAKS